MNFGGESFKDSIYSVSHIQSIIPRVAAPIPNPLKTKAPVKCSNLSFS